MCTHVGGDGRYRIIVLVASRLACQFATSLVKNILDVLAIEFARGEGSLDGGFELVESAGGEGSLIGVFELRFRT